ncbi:MAG TPA: hypothetical protein VI160_02150 [Gemmatimonadales bacterium]
MIAMAGAVAVAVVAAVVSLELGARARLRRHTRPAVWRPGLRLELRQDPALFRQVEPRVRFDINAEGERGGEVRDGEPGLYRILVAGGSSVECLALDQPTSWPGALERELSTDARRRALVARRVHVGNIGRSGIGSGQLDLILEHVLPHYRRLDAIIIMVGASDVLRWLEDGAPPLLGAEAQVDDVLSVHPGQTYGWTPGASALAELVRRARVAWLTPVEIREHAGAWLLAARRMYAEAREVRRTAPDPCVVLDRFDHHLRRIIRRAQGHADRVLLVRQPWFDRAPAPDELAQFWHGGVGKAWKQRIDVVYSYEVLHQLMSRLDAAAARVADELHVPHLDLRPRLRPSLEHYFDMFHYTPAGAAIVAREVAALLVGRKEADRRPSRPVAPRAVSFGAGEFA